VCVCVFFQDKHWEVVDFTKSRIEQFKKIIPLITDFRNPAMRERWGHTHTHTHKMGTFFFGQIKGLSGGLHTHSVIFFSLDLFPSNFGLLLTGHWATFVAQTWQPCTHAQVMSSS